MTDIELMSSQEIAEVLLNRGVSGVVMIEQHKDDHGPDQVGTPSQVLFAARGNLGQLLGHVCGLPMAVLTRHVLPDERERVFDVITETMVKEFETYRNYPARKTPTDDDHV